MQCNKNIQENFLICLSKAFLLLAIPGTMYNIDIQEIIYKIKFYFIAVAFIK